MNIKRKFEKANIDGVLPDTHKIQGDVLYRAVDPDQDFEATYKILEKQ